MTLGTKAKSTDSFLKPQSVDDWRQVRSLSITQIMQVLPHRFPFLLVDRVTEIIPGKPLQVGMSESELLDTRKGTISKAYKNVSVNEVQFLGHFPDNPIFPGVLTVEAMCQAAAFTSVPYVSHTMQGKLPAMRVALVGFDGVRFRKPIFPGDRMDMEVKVTQLRGQLWVFEGNVQVDGKLAAEGEFIAQLIFGDVT